ncbi:MAG: hypothetical protein JKY65_14555 [Planctomycetes bacterium]|nr:hypothetical protein [Planctomycetota bacterium]
MIRSSSLAALALILGFAAPTLAGPGSYVRFEQEGRDAALQTAVAHFTHPDKNVEIVLYGVVHIADKSYYDAVQRDLDSYDVVLYEGVAPGKTKPTEADKGLGEMQKAMGELLGLTFQKEGIDYTRKNLVHADMNMDQLKEAMGGKTINPMGQLVSPEMLKQMGPMLKGLAQLGKSSPGMQRMFKTMMAKQLGNADLSNALGKKATQVILIERNKVVMKVLAEQLKKTTTGRIAIFYGAAHNVDFEQRFKALGWTRSSKRWMSAWTIGNGISSGEEAPAPTRSPTRESTPAVKPKTGARWF